MVELHDDSNTNSLDSGTSTLRGGSLGDQPAREGLEVDKVVDIL